MKIQTWDEVQPDYADLLLTKLSTFNRTYVPDLTRGQDAELIQVFAVSDAEALLGGLTAHCLWNTVHIDLFWVDGAQRGLGIGSALIKACEERAIKNGYENAYVETISWQAKPFYERHGYRLMGTIEDRPKGHSTHYLSKKLSRESS